MSLAREVYVAGVGMSRYGGPPQRLSTRALTAANMALDDARVPFSEIGVVFAGTVLTSPTYAIRLVKDLGLTGVQVIRVENASATGAAAFHEAVHAVAGGRVEVALALGFDDPAASSMDFNGFQIGRASCRDRV